MIVMPEPVLQIRGVSKIYGTGPLTVKALDGINLDISREELVVILGPSGSGKSTLLNILGGLDIPTEGELHYLDHNLTRAGEAELTRYRREHVGFVFQFYNLIPSLTALENVQLVTEIAERPMDARQALALVGLNERGHHFPAELSGGEQQRVAIARAIAKQPDILLCDEPTGALDIGTGRMVLDAIDRINRDLGTATIVITHNAVIAHMATRVIRISGGAIASDQRNERRLSAAELEW